ncbi:MAG TPA: sugar phosphate isomerase/epimerase [Acetobacteraceae bacterium]|nr:sugar phosphate isomerase/epimerase [Acetobacteraceae bacterium]
MRIGLVTDSLAEVGFDALLGQAAELGIEMLEFGCGNWSAAPHLSVDALLESEPARQDFLARIRAHGLAVSALNCSGNPLHPGALGARHRAVTSKAIRLAGLLGVARVVLMSGCPGGPGDANANWVTTAWPPEAARVLAWQWDEVLLPYWRGLAAEARDAGVEKLCLELHGQQNVYNVRTLLRLRDAAGPMITANFDPSHLMWMGADPLAAIAALGGAIGHVHAKDTRIDAANTSVNSLIDTVPNEDVANRAWRYVTLGLGHDEPWWRRFVAALRAAGYDDVLSIEHEDVALPPREGVRRSVELLRRVL